VLLHKTPVVFEFLFHQWFDCPPVIRAAFWYYTTRREEGIEDLTVPLFVEGSQMLLYHLIKNLSSNFFLEIGGHDKPPLIELVPA